MNWYAFWDVLQWVFLIFLLRRNLQHGDANDTHCQQLGQLQAELYEIDPVKFRDYAPEVDR